MQRWEYTEITSLDTPDYLSTLNRLGDAGWELVCVTTLNSSGSQAERYTLKRPRPSDTTR